MATNTSSSWHIAQVTGMCPAYKQGVGRPVTWKVLLMQDPKEATRERIERLKKEGAVEFEEGSTDKGAIPLPKVPVLKQGRAAALEVSCHHVPPQPCLTSLDASASRSLGSHPIAMGLQSDIIT